MKKSAFLLLLLGWLTMTGCVKVRTGSHPAGASLFRLELAEGGPQNHGVTPAESASSLFQNPYPDHQATAIDISTDLSWQFMLTDAADVAYDVFIEADDSTPDEDGCNAAPASLCDPAGTLAYNTHYYWQVVAVDSLGGQHTSPVWEFTTTFNPDIPVFSDDFSTDTGWINENGYFQLDGDQELLEWEIKGLRDQLFYRPFRMDANRVQLSFRIKLLNAGGNQQIAIGLIEDEDTLENEMADRPGFYFLFGYATELENYFALEYIVHKNQPVQTYEPPEGCYDFYCLTPAEHLQASHWDSWNQVELTIDGIQWQATMFDEFGQEIDQLTGTNPATHAHYDGVIFSNVAHNGWEWLSGQLDDVQLFASPQS